MTIVEAFFDVIDKNELFIPSILGTHFGRCYSMLNSDYIHYLLKNDVINWNFWRKENPNVKINLSGANLENKNLNGVDFSEANLFGVNLSRSSLVNAKLSGAVITNSELNFTNLENSDLANSIIVNSDLTGADLFNADLSGANLSKSTLRQTILESTKLISVNLLKTDFEGAVLGNTTFNNLNLGESINLDKCIHRGHSFIDIQTLRNSGNLPLEFLHGCGVSEELINTHTKPVIIPNKISKYFSCFISYSTRDIEFVEKLYDDLMSQNVDCWMDDKNLAPGNNIGRIIENEIKNRDKFVLILSKNSLLSGRVANEVYAALEKKRKLDKGYPKFGVILPIRLDINIDDIDPELCPWAAEIVRDTYTKDFTKWKDKNFYAKAFKEFIKSLEAHNESD